MPPNWACIGSVNSVQTYCGLEMAIMQMTPAASCTHLVAARMERAAEAAKETDNADMEALFESTQP